MSNQYPLPAGYPPPGATYAMNQTPSPQPAPPGFINPQQPAGPAPYGQIPPAVSPGTQGPHGGAYQQPGIASPGPNVVSANMAPVNMNQLGPNMTSIPANQPSVHSNASYAMAGIPQDGQNVVLPYGNRPPEAAKAQQSSSQYNAGAATVDDPILAAELNEAATLVLRDQNAEGNQGGTSGAGYQDKPTSLDPSPAKSDSIGISENIDKRPFYLINEANEKAVMEVHKESTKDGASITLGKKKSENSPGQLWYIGEDGFLRTKLNDMVITAQGSHKEVKTSQATGDARQHWLVDGNKVVNKVFSDECLTVKKGLVKFRDDASVITSKYEGKPAQHWKQIFVDL